MSNFASYARKFLVAVAGGLGILVVAIQDNNLTPSEWVQIAIAALSAIGVYAVKNEPKE